MTKYINCCNCNILSEVPQSNPYKKFCSNRCGALFQNKNSINKNEEQYNKNPKLCILCENSISYKQRINKYCSHSCSAKHINSNKPNSKRKYPKKNCIVCKKIITNPFYCSRKRCGLGKISGTPEERLHRRRMLQREAYARYSAKKKYQTPIDEDLSSIKLFYQNCPKGYEVDHIIPISKGGLHSLKNLQYLTISENRKKSNKIVEPPERFELS